MKNSFLKILLLPSFLLAGCSTISDDNDDNAENAFLSKCSNCFVKGNYLLKSSLTSSGIEADLDLWGFYENDFLLDTIDQPNACSYELNLYEKDRLSVKNRGAFDNDKYIIDIASECSDLAVLDGTRLFGFIGTARTLNIKLDFFYRSLINVTGKIRSYHKNLKDGDKNIVVDVKNHILSTSYYDDREDLNYQTSINFALDDADSLYKPISILCVKTYGESFSRNGEQLIQTTVFSLGGSLNRTSVENYAFDERIEYFESTQIQDEYSIDQAWFSGLLYRYLIYNQIPNYSHPYNNYSLEC